MPCCIGARRYDRSMWLFVAMMLSPKRRSANKKLSLVLGENRIKLAARLVAHLDKRQYQLPVAGLDEELGEIPVVLFSILGWLAAGGTDAYPIVNSDL